MGAASLQRQRSRWAMPCMRPIGSGRPAPPPSPARSDARLSGSQESASPLSWATARSISRRSSASGMRAASRCRSTPSSTARNSVTSSAIPARASPLPVPISPRRWPARRRPARARSRHRRRRPRVAPLARRRRRLAGRAPARRRRVALLHQRHHRATEGRRPHPPQPASRMRRAISPMWTGIVPWRAILHAAPLRHGSGLYGLPARRQG